MKANPLRCSACGSVTKSVQDQCEKCGHKLREKAKLTTVSCSYRQQKIKHKLNCKYAAYYNPHGSSYCPDHAANLHDIDKSDLIVRWSHDGRPANRTPQEMVNIKVDKENVKGKGRNESPKEYIQRTNSNIKVDTKERSGLKNQDNREWFRERLAVIMQGYPAFKKEEQTALDDLLNEWLRK